MNKRAAALVLLLALASRAESTVLVAADLGELARDASTIVRGRVVAVDSRWTEDRRAIETLVTLEAESYLKGPLSGTVQFRVPGGVLGRFRSITVGAPQFAVGNRVIVFLGARGPSLPHVLGLSQGLYRLVSGPRGWMVTPPPVAPSVTLLGGGTAPIIRGDPTRTTPPLDEFERRVRDLVARP